MAQAARRNDSVSATDTHIVLVPSPSGAVPTPDVFTFAGKLQDSLSGDVLIDGQAAAVKGSVAVNQPPHIPTKGPFQRPPSNKGTVQTGSLRVLINGQPAARVGDKVVTCNDPTDLPGGTITTGSSTVDIG